MNSEAAEDAFLDAPALFEQAEMLFKQERFEEALSRYEQAIERDPLDTRFHAGKGTALGTLDRFDEALAAWERALWLNPNSCYHLIFLDAVLTGEDMLMAAEWGIGHEPGNAQPYLYKGRALKMLRRPNEAVAAYRRALELAPDHLSITFEFGNLLMYLQRAEEALSVFQHLCSRQPNRASAHASRAWAYLSLEHHEAGLEACQVALKLAPESVLAWKTRGWLLTRLQRAEEGQAALHRAHELAPNDALQFPNQGLKLREVHPYEPRLIAAAFAWRARLHRMTHDYEGALRATRHALARDPNTPSHYGEQALNLAALQRASEAQAALEEAIRVDPSYAHSSLARHWPSPLR